MAVLPTEPRLNGYTLIGGWLADSAGYFCWLPTANSAGYFRWLILFSLLNKYTQPSCCLQNAGIPTTGVVRPNPFTTKCAFCRRVNRPSALMKWCCKKVPSTVVDRIQKGIVSCNIGITISDCDKEQLLYIHTQSPLIFRVRGRGPYLVVKITTKCQRPTSHPYKMTPKKWTHFVGRG